jgi:steroid delta-isomerase-like uncharacterized protein
MTRDEVIAQSDRVFAAWNAHDPDAIAQLAAPDATISDSPSPDVGHGRDAFRGRAAMILAAFPDCTLERTSIMVEGNRACTEWTFAGTHQGEFLGIAGTGRHVDNRGCTVEAYGDDGLAVSVIAYWDAATFFAQAGAMPTAEMHVATA